MTLVRSVLDLGYFREEARGDEEKLRGIIACARAIRGATGPGRVYAEQKMWDELESVSYECRWQLEAANLPILLGFSIHPTMSSETAASLQVLGQIVDYALESIRFVHPRDSFSSRRRSMAFQILACACRVVDVPRAFEEARAAVRAGRAIECLGALNLLEAYYLRRTALPDDDVITELQALADRTKSRCVAVAALNVLVKTGVIGELTALDRIDSKKQDGSRFW